MATENIELTVRVPVALHAALTTEAERSDVSAAHVVRKAVRDYLRDRGYLNTTEKREA